jgi:Spy/CpxP family protein refolding chaperone
MKKALLLIAMLLILAPSLAQAETGHFSKYIGQESREIKSLSESDIDELTFGKGWGLAKAAELNGVPGPKHLLEMKDEIALTENQIMKIETVFKDMQNKAIKLGKELIELERELNDLFASRTVNDTLLKESLNKIEATHKQLRYIHLAAHLETPSIVSEKQIQLYNELRGYASADPCKNVPEGHNAKMWKKHNGCE